MEKLINLLSIFSVSVVPILGLFIQIMTFINDRNKEKEEQKIQTNHQTGDNYYYEDNRTYSSNFEEEKLKTISISQQNINDISNWFTKYSFFFLLIILLFQFLKLSFPFPNLPLFSLEQDKETLLIFIVKMLYRALILTAGKLSLLIAIICIILAIKKLVTSNTILKKIFTSSYYIINAILYWFFDETISKIQLQKINFFTLENIDSIINFVKLEKPFIILLLVIILYLIANMLIKFIFETDHTKPSLKLIKIAIKRIAFFLILIIYPIILILLTTQIYL